MKKWFLLSFFSSIIIVNANAKDKNNIVFDYSDMSLSSIGIYNPKLEGEKTGLNAELIARKNGIDNLEKYFESSCDGLDKSSLDVKNDWENSFHSQGTEIYSNGVLAVTLQAPIKQIFKTSVKLRKGIKTDEGEKISFQIPEQVPLTAIRCGTLELNLGDNKKIHVIPIDSVKLDSANKKTTIHLIFNPKTSDLELDPDFKDKNNDILDNSTLADSEDLSSEVLPISVVINTNNAVE